MAKKALTRKKPFGVSDYDDLMGHFGLARSVLNVCYRSLGTYDDVGGPGEEIECLAVAIEKLRTVYNQFDLLGLALQLPVNASRER